MSLSAYRNFSETLKEFQITYTEQHFVDELPFEVSDYFRQDLQLMMTEGAWAQCLSEMVAAQRINDSLDTTVFGITSNGNAWELGQLKETTFTQNPSFYTIQELDQLFAIINYIFQQCENQLEMLVAVQAAARILKVASISLSNR